MINGLKEALHADFERAKRDNALSAAQIANVYGKSPTSSWPHNLLNVEAPFTLPMLKDWASMTGCVNLMQWIGSVTHHFVAPIPTGEVRKDIACVLKEFSDYLQTTARATADGEVTADEMIEVEREAIEACSAILAEVDALKKEAREKRHGRAKTLRAVS